MKRWWTLFKRAFGVSASVMLVYRANIVFFLIFETLFLLSQFLMIDIGFDLAGSEVRGWTKEQAFLLTAVNAVSHQLFICFFINPIFSLGMNIWNGQFDYVLLKPLNPLVTMLATSQMVVSNFPNLFINIGLVVYFLIGQTEHLTVGGALAFLLFVPTGLAVRVALSLLCMAPGFLSERLIEGEEGYWALGGLGRFPMAIFPCGFELALTFVLPVAMFSNLPVGALYGKFAATYMLFAFLASAFFVVWTLWVFSRCMRRYQSVNSGV
jgi:ABC-2 type transport system permease protein